VHLQTKEYPPAPGSVTGTRWLRIRSETPGVGDSISVRRCVANWSRLWSGSRISWFRSRLGLLAYGPSRSWLVPSVCLLPVRPVLTLAAAVRYLRSAASCGVRRMEEDEPNIVT